MPLEKSAFVFFQSKYFELKECENIQQDLLSFTIRPQ